MTYACKSYSTNVLPAVRPWRWKCFRMVNSYRCNDTSNPSGKRTPYVCVWSSGALTITPTVPAGRTGCAPGTLTATRVTTCVPTGRIKCGFGDGCFGIGVDPFDNWDGRLEMPAATAPGGGAPTVHAVPQGRQGLVGDVSSSRPLRARREVDHIPADAMPSGLPAVASAPTLLACRQAAR